jgi:hypothetical protein
LRSGRGWRAGLSAPLLALGAAIALAGPRADPVLDDEQARAILAKTAEVRLAPDLDALAPDEREALARLLEAGGVLQGIYELSNHRGAERARRLIAAQARSRAGAVAGRRRADLYRLFRGPIATTLDNRRLPIVAVDTLVPGKNVYPWGVARAELDRYLEEHPDERARLLHPRTVVRRGTAQSLRADLAALGRHAALRALHPALEADLRARLRRPSVTAFYAVPYALAFADSLARVSLLLHQAASALERTDAELAGYLRHRARDLLANDYEAGDAAWVTGRFGRLNAQLGAYETYDDELYGVKAFHGASLLLQDVERTRRLRSAMRGLQQLEDALPYAPHKRVRDQIAVGIYDVIADFGEARGTNTASILPNETATVRRHGRTILMRRNILLDRVLVEVARQAWQAALDRRHHAEFDPEGTFQRTLWHEIGHYLGPEVDRHGRALDLALLEESGTFEEMKADLVALFVARELRRAGYYDEPGLRAVYASGIGRVLLKNRPRRDQVYGTMQLMQLNWYLDRGLLAYHPGSRKLRVRYDRYHEVVASLLEEILAIQSAGDRAAADRFIARWAVWDERHEALAAAMRAAETSRFRLVRYAALGE